MHLERVLSLDKRLIGIGLDIEPSKTNLMIFSKVRENSVGIEISGWNIHNVCCAKFLGIAFDSKLKFDTQCTQVCKKADKALDIMRFLNRVSWGMETNTALNVYKAYVRAIIEYAIFVYYPKERQGRKKLKKVQNKGIRIALGYRNSTPVNVMTAEAKVCKIKDRAGLLASNYWTKVTSENWKEVESRMNLMEYFTYKKKMYRAKRKIFVVSRLVG